ncbi:hypothetical protein RHSIM_Rhsim03G0023300 [Rhododendron simsii]|uniref:Uncharacterized protein n=1 Tax=Rhododendron simsii TaxID=118357 RepID=A0A834HGP8_RHOSS|nr:hypothetical protein RHSIM_Rhsim03G0023300 [Rhododendron simsii]
MRNALKRYWLMRALSSISLYEKLFDESWRSLIGNTFWLPLIHQEKQERSNSKE